MKNSKGVVCTKNVRQANRASYISPHFLSCNIVANEREKKIINIGKKRKKNPSQQAEG